MMAALLRTADVAEEPVLAPWRAADGGRTGAGGGPAAGAGGDGDAPASASDSGSDWMLRLPGLCWLSPCCWCSWFRWAGLPGREGRGRHAAACSGGALTVLLQPDFLGLRSDLHPDQADRHCWLELACRGREAGPWDGAVKAAQARVLRLQQLYQHWGLGSRPANNPSAFFFGRCLASSVSAQSKG